MPAQLGNQAWRARSRHGRRLKYETPDLLWDDCCEYFQWVEDNPLLEAKLVSYQGVSEIEYIPKMRAMTLSGLLLFIEMDHDTWTNYRQREDFTGVTKKADEIIYNQKFTGASADLLNANIIARDLGLKDSSSREITGKDGGPVKVIAKEMTDAEATQSYQDIIKDI